jgi:hypothetical protein
MLRCLPGALLREIALLARWAACRRVPGWHRIGGERERSFPIILKPLQGQPN